MEGLTIGQLAREAGVNSETIRFYERRGLIPKPPRPASGYRRYPPETVRRIRFIRHAKELGFSLGEISELLSLRLDPETTCIEVKRRAEDKLRDIERKIQALQGMRGVLAELAGVCKGRGPLSDCPILEALDREE
jgi:MerR family copper efflux transcriptional regulator